LRSKRVPTYTLPTNVRSPLDPPKKEYLEAHECEKNMARIVNVTLSEAIKGDDHQRLKEC
jgi:hypothetical protein